MRFVLFVLLVAAPAWAQTSLRERMLVAEDQRASTDPDLTPLKQGLRSPDVMERRQAVRAIGRLERPELMPIISPLLTDRHPDVRMETVNAIGQMARGADGLKAAKTRLMARVRGEQTPRVRGVVAATLGRLPYTSATDAQEAERAIAALVPAAATVANLDEVAGGVEGLEALIRQSGKLAPASADTLSRLRAVARIEGRAQDAEVLKRIRRLATLALTAAGAVERMQLEAGVQDSDDEVRRLTMIAARAVPGGSEAVLMKGLADVEARVRYEALQTWGRTREKQSCAPVLAALRDSNPHVVLLALDLLGNGCPDAAAAAAALQAVAQTITSSSRAWHPPAHAMVALAKVAPADARKLLPLYVNHPIWQVRMYAARAAGAGEAFDALATLGRDAHDNVREAALSALVEHKRPEAVAIALDALARPDHQLVITASRALAGAGNDRTVPALLGALARLTAEQRDNSRDARMAILTRLEEFGADDADRLRPYLTDFDVAVARKAAEMLTKGTGQAAVASARPLAHPPVRLADIDALRTVRLRFVMAGRGTFDLRLLVDDAPLSALRVATRAREGYYNGLTFHRVVPNFVIQGGSPGANEYVGDGAFMRDEVGLLSHRRGTVGISTRGRDTGDAQIFVNLIDSPRLDHTYTVFAEVVAGLDVVDAVLEGDQIERVEVIQANTRRSSR